MALCVFVGLRMTQTQTTSNVPETFTQVLVCSLLIRRSICSAFDLCDRLGQWLFWLDLTLTYTHLTALFPGLPRWTGTWKVKPIWILLMQQTLSGSGIRWAVYKSAPRSRQITMPAPHHSVFHRPGALPAAQPTASKHWRHENVLAMVDFLEKQIWKRRYYLAAHRRVVNVLTSNSAFFIFAVLVVWFSHSRPYKIF